MISLHLTRWMLSYVEFTVIGGSPERFLNQCARAGIYLWNLRSGRPFRACVAAGRYRALRVCARRAGCRLRAGKRHGLAFATKNIRNRKGILVGAVGFAAILWLLSLHVWTIEITGEVSIPPEKIEAELTRRGVVPGMLRKDVDPQRLQQELMLAFPKISWLSVNTRGCTAQVSLEEKVERPPMEQKDVLPGNVVAGATGQVITIKVYAGTAQVKDGDAVTQGQLLISAEVKDESGAVEMKHAAGEVIAETKRVFTVEIPMKRPGTQPTGNVATRRSVQIFGVRIPLTLIPKPDGNYRTETARTRIRLMNSILPVGLYEEKWVEQRNITVTLTKEQAVREARSQVEQSQKSMLKNAQVLSRREESTVSEEKLRYTETISCREDIARESEIQRK